MILAVWIFIKPHLPYWIAAVALFVGFRTWIAEHDARLRAEIEVKSAQVTIDGLKAQIATRQVETEKQVQVIVKEVQAAQTPAQQVAEVNKLAPTVHAELIPADASKVTVELAPLLAEESECRQNAIKLGACQQEISDRTQIEVLQSSQVDLLKKKPGFWHRLASGSKKVAIGIAVGVGAVLVARGIH